MGSTEHHTKHTESGVDSLRLPEMVGLPGMQPPTHPGKPPFGAVARGAAPTHRTEQYELGEAVHSTSIAKKSVAEIMIELIIIFTLNLTPNST